MRDWLNNNGGCEAPWHATCNLETLKASSGVPIQTWSPENHENQWYKFLSESKDPKISRGTIQVQGKMNVPAEAESEFGLPPLLHSAQTCTGLKDTTYTGEQEPPYHLLI